MNSARERAVEAGAMVDASKAHLLAGLAAAEHVSITTGGVTYIGFESKQLAAFIVAGMGAAFPILADELVKVALAKGARYEKSKEAVCESAYSMSHEIATALRARIQQMAEAEHE